MLNNVPGRIYLGGSNALLQPIEQSNDSSLGLVSLEPALGIFQYSHQIGGRHQLVLAVQMCRKQSQANLD